MKKTMTLSAALLSGFILLSSACAKSVEVENPEQADNARIYHATVKSVHDGDTIRVTDSHGREIRIRMAYIDAPELNQAHGQSSRDALCCNAKTCRLRCSIPTNTAAKWRVCCWTAAM